MDAIASCGVASVCRPARGTFLGRHVVLPRRVGRLVVSDHQLSAVKPNPKISFVDLDPYENDDVIIHVEDDVRKDNTKMKTDSSSNNSSPHLSEEQHLLAESAHDDLEASRVAASAGDFVMKLRKPGVVYDDVYRRSIPKKKSAPRMFIKSRSEDMKNITLLRKPEIGKPHTMGSRPDHLTDWVPSDGGMISQSYKPQKSKYELYFSRPIQVSLNQKPQVMTTKPETEIPVPSIDKSLKEGANNPEAHYHTSPEKKQKTPPLVSNFTERSGIGLRKPSIPTDDNKTNQKPEPKPNPLLDMQMDSSLSSQADPKSELQLKPSLDKARREDLRNVVIEKVRKEVRITDLRKPDVPLADNTKMDTRPEKQHRLLLDENRHDYRDSSNVTLQERGETAITDLSELDLKPKLETSVSMVTRYSTEARSNALLHKKPQVEVGLQQTNQRIDGDKPMRNESSDAGSISSEEEVWKRVEELLNNDKRVIVELTEYNNEGFFATLGSVVGFIPYRNLSIRYNFFPFESWLRKKGVNRTLYWQKVHNMDSTSSNDSLPDLGLGTKTLEQNQQIGEPLPNSSSALNFGELFPYYQQEKDAFLSSFIGQKLKVSIVMADKGSRKVLFTGKRKENQELLDKKRNLMAKLKVGDIVKCCIYRFAYFGIFVEIDGVSALIPQAEILYDGTLDLLSSLKLGQTIDARVHQLNYTLERITLSLKGVTPDPLKDDFEAVVGGDMSFGGTLKEVQPEEEWEDVESLIKELEKLEEVNTISKGTFFLSSGLAPTFQVYMAPMVDDRYKLLARFGNKAQEILVKASMDEEKMKNAILASTSRIA